MTNELKNKMHAYNWDLNEIVKAIAPYTENCIVDCDAEHVYFMRDEHLHKIDVEGNIEIAAICQTED